MAPAAEFAFFELEFDAMPFFIRPVTGITLVVALMATATGSVTALAESGSAGGSIGNDEKSLSGSRDAAFG